MGFKRWIGKAKKIISPGSLVLMYHRVAEPAWDPWELSVSRANFEAQLQVLQKTGRVRPLASLLNGLSSKNKQKPCIVITFDDGYADNFLNAKPLLEKYALPATFFISSKHLGTEKLFWWDDLAFIFLEKKYLPPTLSFSAKGAALSFDLKEEVLTEATYQQHKTWTYTQEPPSGRAKIYMELWKLLSSLTYQEQQHLLTELKSWAGTGEQTCKSCFSMAAEQLRQLAANDLFTIGAHTVTHPALAFHAEEFQRQEIGQNKTYLEDLTKLKVNTFAYPSGNFNQTTLKLLKELGFRAAFTTQPGAIRSECDSLRLGRFQVNDWAQGKFKQALNNWV